ncbi:glycine cleavage system protein GcvH [Luminiphilus sp.]|nr:glycine cleavage system protein GcvH [Luminiphilus sp.]MDA8678892.1 glycine cleavage system protein GcvH [Luminiphilus sp.]
MSQNPINLHYAATHEWARLEADGSVTVGITDHAQQALGDVMYVELPAVGAVVLTAGFTGIVESVKAASDIYAPIAGTVLAVNDELADTPERINEDPYGAGWFYRLQPEEPHQLNALLNAGGYASAVAAETP